MNSLVTTGPVAESASRHDDIVPAHPALSRNDTLYTASLAARVFENPERFMEAWQMAMSGNDNDAAAILLNNLRLRPDYFGPVRRTPRRFAFSAMSFQREVARTSAALRDLVISTRRQVDSYILKAMARQGSGYDGSQHWLIGQAIASAIAELLGGLAAERDGAVETGKVTRAVETVVNIARDSAARPGMTNAPELGQLSIDMRKMALSAAHDEHFRNMTASLIEIERDRAARNARTGPSHDEPGDGADTSPEAGPEAGNDAGADMGDDAAGGDTVPGTWRAGGKSSGANKRSATRKSRTAVKTADHPETDITAEEEELAHVR
uniref:hypothetical protein n=1 Tax=Ochrobactrum sp. LM19 TaxID=1449781 RepID=UPI0015E7FF11|nr:hypothetical protein [Ochrobactrum sp. LM19]